MPKTKSLYFTAPQKVEVREVDLPTLKENEILVQSICSAISAGTEMLVYCGEFPNLVDSHDSFSSNLKYPTTYGYACVGKVVECGSKVDETWKDRLVFSFQPHASHFISTPESLFPIPASISPDSACFLPNMETAVNLVQDGAPILGERALVIGQGMVGLLTTSLLSEFPLDKLTSADRYELRCNASKNIGGVTLLENTGFTDPKNSLAYAQNDKFDLTFELSGSPSALNDAIRLTKFSGRIIIGSWYGQKQAGVDLGGVFHRSRIKIISSQVSTISPELSGRWDKSRRFDVAWKALERIKPEKWITHRFHIDEADKAYQLLDKKPQETIQVVFDYS